MDRKLYVLKANRSKIEVVVTLKGPLLSMLQPAGYETKQSIRKEVAWAKAPKALLRRK